MKRQTIHDAYQDIRPDEAARERMLENILLASDHAAVRKDVPMRRFKKKTFTIAAMIALAVLMMGCAVVAMTLNDLRIGEYSYTQPAWINADGERFEETQVTKNVLSLQGIVGSTSQKAAQEWYEFEQSYDPDDAILSASDDFQVPSAYKAYHVYSQEMIDKVDEIAAKYGLGLAGEIGIVQDWSKDVFFEALGLESLFTENAKAEMGFGAGYFYECGNFKMEFECEVSDPALQWKHPLWLSVSYKDKSYLDTVFVRLNSDSTQQRILTLDDGTEVLLVMVEDAQNGDSAHVFYDREDAFISLRLDTNYFNNDGTVDVMRQEDVELVVGMMDFSVKPQKPDMVDAVQKLETADKAYQEEVEARIAEMGDPFRVHSYQELSPMYENGQFALIDLNGDGQEECILWDEQGLGTVYTMLDGTTEPILESFEGIFVCKDQVIGFYEEVGEAYFLHGYLKMEGNEMVWLDRLVFDRANEQWAHSNDGIRAEETISTEEAERIMASYIQIGVEMKPVSELTE